MNSKNKVTRAELRKMKIGDSKLFSLITPNKCISAKVTCSQLKEEGLIFKVSINVEAACVAITRIG